MHGNRLGTSRGGEFNLEGRMNNLDYAAVSTPPFRGQKWTTTQLWLIFMTYQTPLLAANHTNQPHKLTMLDLLFQLQGKL